MNKKFTAKQLLLALLLIITVAVALDWNHFKDGLLGETTRTEQCWYKK